MVKSFLSGLIHKFMANRLRAEMTSADAKLVERVVEKNAVSQSAPKHRRNSFLDSFRLA